MQSALLATAAAAVAATRSRPKNELQRSSQYSAATVQRFARVKRYRQDKTAAEAGTPATVRKLFNARSTTQRVSGTARKIFLP